jgi:hypothetical protein
LNAQRVVDFQEVKMAEVSVESIIEQVKQLPVKDQFELAAQLEKRTVELARQMRGRYLGPSPYRDDYEADHQWLRENHRHYTNQWVALKDGRLLAHGREAKEVFAAAEAQGVERPLFFFIEDTEVPTLPDF